MSKSCLPKARWWRSVTCATAFALFSVAAASAQDTYKIGMSAGLTGYAATVDRAWRDGVEIAIATLNARGGIMGRKIELVVEDNRSEPQEAVTVYRKMIYLRQGQCVRQRLRFGRQFRGRTVCGCAPKFRWCCARSCRSSLTT